MHGPAPQPLQDRSTAAREPRQRWRLIVARPAASDAARPDPGPAEPGQRDLVASWQSSLVETGLPLAIGEGRRRSALVFGAPMPTGIALERELADLFLTERRPIDEVRACLLRTIPAALRLVDLHDVWLGEPPLPGQVAAADYRLRLGPIEPAIPVEALESAAARLLAADALPRTRSKGAGTVSYDLRPLLAAVEVVRRDPPQEVRLRTRFHPELGTGRPEEVLAALADAAGVGLAANETVRERVLLREELEPETGQDRHRGAAGSARHGGR